MADYSFTTNDRQEAAITKARAAYNASLPEQRDEEGNVVTPTPGTMANNGAYLRMILVQAVRSWISQYATVTVAERDRLLARLDPADRATVQAALDKVLEEGV